MSISLSRGPPIARTHVTGIVAYPGDFKNPNTEVNDCSKTAASGYLLTPKGALLQVAERIDGLAVDPDLEVDVRTEAVAGAV